MKVLVVDDHALFVEALRTLLGVHGIEVAGTAADGLQALAQARALHPDLILMDIQMPRCDGLAATRLIKAEQPDTKIVMLTMSADDHDLFEAIKSGASGYLLKRLRPEEFFDCLATLEGGGAPFSPGMAPKILAEFARQATGPAAADAGSEQQEVAGLSARQVQVLTLIAQGQRYHEVADALGLSESAVKYHMAQILEKLHLQNRAQVVAFATHMGLEGKPQPEDS